VGGEEKSEGNTTSYDLGALIQREGRKKKGRSLSLDEKTKSAGHVGRTIGEKRSTNLSKASRKERGEDEQAAKTYVLSEQDPPRSSQEGTRTEEPCSVKGKRLPVQGGFARGEAISNATRG